MLLHIYFCDGCFIQMLKDSKNLLKMSLKILFIKRKKEIPFHSLLSPFRPLATLSPPAWPGLLAQVPPRPARLPLFLPPPVPSWAGPASRPAQQPRASASPAPGNCRAQPLTPGPHLSAPPPTSRVQRPLPVKAEPPPRRASWERPRAPRPR